MMFPLCDECGEGEYRDPFTSEPLDPCFDCPVTSAFVAEMRRYLYRNVAAEYRKIGDMERHMPDLPGWT